MTFHHQTTRGGTGRNRPAAAAIAAQMRGLPAHDPALDRAWRGIACLVILAASLLMTGAALANQHGQQGRPMTQPLDFTDWAVCHSRKGSVDLRTFDLQPSLPTFLIDSDARSTASISSPRLRPQLPYRVTFWVRVSQDRYNGFMIYDAADASRQKTDIQVYLHDDRGDRTADNGWHGEVWVKDGVGRYSVTSVRRGDWVKFAVERRRNGMVTLLIDDRAVGTYTARSPQPMERIVGVGDNMRSWWHGNASWGPVEISTPGR